MSHDYHTQLVSKVLHFMNLDKSSHLVDFIQILHHIRFITIEQKIGVDIQKLEIAGQIKKEKNNHWLQNFKLDLGAKTLNPHCYHHVAPFQITQVPGQLISFPNNNTLF